MPCGGKRKKKSRKQCIIEKYPGHNRVLSLLRNFYLLDVKLVCAKKDTKCGGHTIVVMS